MKTLLLSAILLVGLNGWGQLPTNFKWEAIDVHYDISDTAIEYDTIRIIMLCCDTSYIPELNTIVFYYSKDTTKNIGVGRNRVSFVYWLFGYEVLKMIPPGWYDDIHYANRWEHNSFLGENKKTLSKSIIVWQSKKATP